MVKLGENPEIKDSLNRLYGNDDIYGLLSRDAESGGLSHAYILEGPKGSGKKLLSLSLCAVMALSEKSGIGDAEKIINVKKIFGGICPDVNLLAPAQGKKTMGVDDVRNLRRMAYIKPNDLDFKAFIIDRCGDMTTQAQNALLKILEEPPASTYFFLLCENSASLLPTVRSRAPTIRMRIFTPEELGDYLVTVDERARKMSKNSPDDFAALTVGAGGAVGAALEMLDKQSVRGENVRENVILCCRDLFGGKAADVYRAAMSMPSKRDELLDFLSLLRSALRDCIALKSGVFDDMLFGSADKLDELSKKMTVSRIISVDILTERLADNISANVNVANAKLDFAANCCARLGI